MRPSVALWGNRQAVREVVLNHRASDVRVFGSVLHGSDTEESDLDLLLEPSRDKTLDYRVDYRLLAMTLLSLRAVARQSRGVGCERLRSIVGSLRSERGSWIAASAIASSQ